MLEIVFMIDTLLTLLKCDTCVLIRHTRPHNIYMYLSMVWYVQCFT